MSDQPMLNTIAPCHFSISGKWNLANVREISQVVEQEGKAIREQCTDAATIIIDGGAVTHFDTVGAYFLLKLFGRRDGTFQLKSFDKQDLRVFELTHERLLEFGKTPRTRPPGVFASVGKATLEVIDTSRSILAFVGYTLVEIARSFANPKRFRMKEFFAHLEQTALNPIPIVAMVMFLIGVVLSYLFSGQFERYGANIFIVDATSITICRELSPVVVAIIMAGRSGSAFTAHIGAMRISEEVDALQTIGLSAMRVLVVPRVLALVIGLPLMVFVGDIFGILGSMLIADTTLGITGATFLDRLQGVLPPRSFYVGIGKAPVFALFIAIIGCRMGLTVQRNARSLGLSTTSTVVQSIVSVILLDAFFAVLFMQLGI